jgi:hypothetical protein
MNHARSRGSKRKPGVSKLTVTLPEIVSPFWGLMNVMQGSRLKLTCCSESLSLQDVEREEDGPSSGCDEQVQDFDVE